MSKIDRHEAFDTFVSTYRRIAGLRGLDWEIPHDQEGAVAKPFRWDLCELTGTPKPPAYHLSNVGLDRSVLSLLKEELEVLGLVPPKEQPLSEDWQDYLKATAVRGLFEKRSRPQHIYNGLLRPIRALATCCSGKEPWQLTSEDVASALKVISKVDRSEKLRALVEAQVVCMDENQLSIACPLLGLRKEGPRSDKWRTTVVRANLDDRRRADRLPGAREFWEMLRIVLEESPETFYDAIRFGAVELGILMGLRVEEIASIPFDPIVLKTYMDAKGGDVAKRGGVGHTMFLRHFSEKQGLRSAKSVLYAETSTSVLRMFEDEASTIIDKMAMMTAPLRERLSTQIRTGRIFPEYDLEEVVPLSEIYTRLTGNPFVFDGPGNTELSKRYRESLDLAILDEIQSYQNGLAASGASFSMAFNVFAGRSQNRWMIRRSTVTHQRLEPASGKLASVGLLISELEDGVRKNLPTKLSDVEGFPLEGNRELGINECLFLVPKRALGEGRNGGVCDIKRYAFVGRLTSQDISSALGVESQEKVSFFRKYGLQEAEKFGLNSHSLRHMHNNELFAAGVADTIITHRFGRKSVAQSHEYDSRTLAQELSDMELPDGTADLLIGPARDAFKLIVANRGAGKIVDEFRRIQKSEGDEAAIVFLAAEADGMQITPYGLCLNSFVVEPCPRHLECFGGCSHLFRTGKTSETNQLKKLAERYRAVLSSIDGHPGSDSAKSKARAQAESRLASVELAIKTAPGTFVFPEGTDLSRPFREVRMNGLIE